MSGTEITLRRYVLRMALYVGLIKKDHEKKPVFDPIPL
jgi:hypothetical protein